MSEDQDKVPKQGGLLSGCHCWGPSRAALPRGLLLASAASVVITVSRLQVMLGLLGASRTPVELSLGYCC